MRNSAFSVLAAGWFGIGAAAAPVDLETGRLQALALVHDGRFEEARATLDRLPVSTTDPLSTFFPAYVDYWTLLYDPENRALRDRFERELERTLEIVDALPRSRAAEGELWGGTTRLLLAQLRAWERRSVAAAFEAGRAKRLLDRVDRRGGSEREHLFALGTYNYMADRVPAFVKGIRALLFLPGGDEQLGLKQLERAAANSTYFRLDARLLLVTVYSHRKERRYEDAQREIDLALHQAGDTVVVRHAAARIALILARPADSAAHLDRALAVAKESPRAHDAVLANLELLRARADFALFRPDLALRRVEALLENGIAVPPDVREDADVLRAESRAVLGDPAWERVREVVGASGSAAPALRLAESHPEDAAAALMAGRALLLAARADEASAWLRRAEAAAEKLPSSWVGPCRLLTGQALDLQGKRGEAIQYYRRAADSAPFSGRDAAQYWQTTPYRTGS